MAGTVFAGTEVTATIVSILCHYADYGTYAGTEVAMDALTESKYVRLRPYVSYIRGSRDVV